MEGISRRSISSNMKLFRHFNETIRLCDVCTELAEKQRHTSNVDISLPYKAFSIYVEKVKFPEVPKRLFKNFKLDGGAQELSSQWIFSKAWHRSIDFFFNINNNNKCYLARVISSA